MIEKITRYSYYAHVFDLIIFVGNSWEIINIDMESALWISQLYSPWSLIETSSVILEEKHT